ncbi:MAG: hypothetical protein WB524_25900, partial [Acidobacteriaceae bacterium]
LRGLGTAGGNHAHAPGAPTRVTLASAPDPLASTPGIDPGPEPNPGPPPVPTPDPAPGPSPEPDPEPYPAPIPTPQPIT